MEKLRIRLVFEDPDILSDAQKSEGLNQSWFLVDGEKCPKIRDLYALLLRIFDLSRSCPNGLLLYMDGFVLPLFETTCILKDKDIISVKKKGGTSTDIFKVGDTVEEPEVVEKQQLQTALPLLANEEFDKEEGEYQSESEDNEEQSEDGLPLKNTSRAKAVSKKRKSSTKLQSSKNKKHRLVVPDGVGEDNHKDQIQSNHDNGVLSRKSPRKKEKKSMTKSKKNRGITAPESADGSSSPTESTSSAKSDKPQQNEKGTEATLDTPKKLPSRSARRKKAKRQWLRAMNNISKKNAVSDTKEPLNQKQRRAKVEKKEVVCQSKGLLYWKPSREGHNDTKIGHKESSEKNDEHENVPIVVRPGHIRFEPLEEDQAVQQSEVLMETFQWNGITSKRKGQKWGTEKTSSNQRNGYQHFNNDLPDVSNIEKKITTSDTIDFDKLHPLTGLPKEGDVIVYRLLELSSTWTPELSSFRVGRVFWYKPESSAILLLPVPEYPILDKLDEDGSVTQADNFLYKEDESVAQPDNSLYKEDGSLEVDFSSLVDVRILKHSNSDSGKDVSDEVNKSPLCNKNGIPSLVHDDSDKQKHTPGTDKGDVNPWEQLSEALDEKKAELSAENNWIKGNSGRSSWKYGAARGGAIGPVMARLRLQKHI